MEKPEMDTIELSLIEILQVLLKRWWIILISMVLCAALMFAYCTVAITPMYGIKIQFYVAPEFGNSQITSAVTAYQTSTYAREALTTYMKLLDNNEFYDLLETETNGKCVADYSSRQLSSMISYSDVSDTDLFYATIVSPDPGDAYVIAEELSKLAPDRIREIKGFDALKVTDSPKYDRVSRVNNSTSRNTVIAALLGAVVSALAIVVIKIFDVRISDEEDLHKNYENVPVLGVIPNFEDISSKSGKKYGRYSDAGGKYGEKSE